MRMEEFFHMTTGDGELSYAKNSSVQREALSMNQDILESTIQSLISEQIGLSKGLNIADLGCGVGPAPLTLISLVMEVVQRKCKELKLNNETHHQVSKLQMYMNDLPSNDFNLLFKDLLSLKVLKRKDDGVPLCFVMGVPGSYYDVLFPCNTLHFVHANYTLHWLSKAPPGLYDEQGMSINKRNIYISETSSRPVAIAYRDQFEQDFIQFLKCRSKEVVTNGSMLLTLRGRPCSSDSFTWTSFEFKIFIKALTCLVSEGLINEEMLDNFDFPCYFANTEELESIVKKEGSFEFEISRTMVLDIAPEVEDKWERAQIISNFIRAFSESLVSRHFGEDIVTPLYDKLIYYAFQHLDHAQPAQNHAVTVLLRKK
ncbi:caffeine synthase 1-like [Chenopodium quinoa]|uniref:Uncharacterized protein n=1 Tax=Chenopodium quinoa TaxID=63459 RepID=A0A803LUV5_CHEQI|nr:caffeine synthase 1-like [Chenopodium quinoa]